jgi:hypothetical protein
MSTRILRCGSNVENYNLCISEKVAGFLNRGPQTGDIIYLAVKINNQSLCGARGILSDVTDNKPWKDADSYVNCLTITNLEYCKPFDLDIILSPTDKKFWYLKYMQRSPKLDEKVSKIINDKFNKNKSESFHEFKYYPVDDISNEKIEIEESISGEETDDLKPEDVEKIIKEIPDAKIKILGTFLTVNFLSETDKLRGLESLVNENFHSLFSQYSDAKAILIPENRMFLSAGIEVQDGYTMPGIRSIPDALLLVYDKQTKNKLNVYIVEYKCYGEKKYRSIVDKSNYFNGQILPQMMKYASHFSVVTDRLIRDRTITEWSDIIINYIFDDKSLQSKFTSWVKEIDNNIDERRIGLKMSNLLHNAFRNNLKVMLIIDDLSTEQKDTLENVIKAFKLDNGESVKFIGHVVKLVQKINIITEEAEYALTVQ